MIQSRNQVNSNSLTMLLSFSRFLSWMRVRAHTRSLSNTFHKSIIQVNRWCNEEKSNIFSFQLLVDAIHFHLFEISLICCLNGFCSVASCACVYLFCISNDNRINAIQQYGCNYLTNQLFSFSFSIFSFNLTKNTTQSILYFDTGYQLKWVNK